MQFPVTACLDAHAAPIFPSVSRGENSSSSNRPMAPASSAGTTRALPSFRRFKDRERALTRSAEDRVQTDRRQKPSVSRLNWSFDCGFGSRRHVLRATDPQHERQRRCVRKHGRVPALQPAASARRSPEPYSRARMAASRAAMAGFLSDSKSSHAANSASTSPGRSARARGRRDPRAGSRSAAR